jgi:hypothetical protein
VKEMSTEQFNKMIELLEDIRKWSKFQGWRSVKEVLLDALNDDLSKLTYHLSDGRPIRDIAAKLPISFETIRRNWQKWAKIGIVEPMKVRGGGTRYKRIFSLDEFGVELPKISSLSVESLETLKNGDE